MSQHMEALARANHVRKAQAELKARLRSLPIGQSRRLLADLLDDPPEELARMRVLQAVTACRCLGAHRARPLLVLAEVGREGKRISELTDRQRGLLAQALRGELVDVWRDAA